MSFILKTGNLDEKERQVHVFRRRYFHNILQYNITTNQSRKQHERQSKIDQERKFNAINQQALQSLISEKQTRKQIKLSAQEELKQEYQKQIRQKQQKAKKEKEADRNYLKLLLQYSQSQDDRRVRDIMRLYNRGEYKGVSMDQKVKTEGAQIDYNPYPYSNPNYNAERKREFEFPRYHRASLQKDNKSLLLLNKQPAGKSTVNSKNYYYPQQNDEYNPQRAYKYYGGVNQSSVQ